MTYVKVIPMMYSEIFVKSFVLVPEYRRVGAIGLMKIESTSIHETFITRLLFTQLHLLLAPSLEDLHIIQSWYRGNRINPSSCDCLANFPTQGCNFSLTDIHLQLTGCEKKNGVRKMHIALLYVASFFIASFSVECGVHVMHCIFCALHLSC